MDKEKLFDLIINMMLEAFDGYIHIPFKENGVIKELFVQQQGDKLYFDIVTPSLHPVKDISEKEEITYIVSGYLDQGFLDSIEE